MCGLFGVVAYNNMSSSDLSSLALSLGKASEIRGTDAGGFSFTENNKLKLVKNSGSISLNGVFDTVPNTWGIMGHTRLGTGASEKNNFNNHPFPSTIKPYTMAHNGIINNDLSLASTYNLPDTKVQTDSYIVVRMLDHLHNGVLSMDNLKDVVEKLEGTYNLTFQDKESIWIIKNNNPLHVINIKELGAYVYASTKEILYNALAHFYNVDDFTEYLMSRSGDSFGTILKLNSGDIVRIMKDGTIIKGSFKPKEVVKSYTYPNTTLGVYDHDYGYGYNYNYDYDYPLEYNDENVDTCFLSTLSEHKNDLTKAVYGDTKALDMALVYNGVEAEAVYDTHGNEFYSKYLGRMITVDGEDIIQRLKAEDFLVPFGKDYFSGHYITEQEYDKIAKVVNKNKTYKALIKNLLSGVKNKEVLKSLTELFETYFVITLADLVPNDLPKDTDIEDIVEGLPFTSLSGTYDTMQLTLANVFDGFM